MFKIEQNTGLIFLNLLVGKHSQYTQNSQYMTKTQRVVCTGCLKRCRTFWLFLAVMA